MKNKMLFILSLLFIVLIICPANATHQNLFINPSFETEGDDTEDAYNWQQEFNTFRSDEYSLTGNWSMKQESVTTSYSRNFRNVPQTIEVLGDVAYVVGGHYYLIDNEVDDADDFRIRFIVSWLDEEGEEIQSEAPSEDLETFEEWTYIRDAFLSPEEAKYAVIEVESQYNGDESTDIYWDDMVLSGPVDKPVWPSWMPGQRRKILNRESVFNHRRRIDTIGDIIE